MGTWHTIEEYYFEDPDKIALQEGFKKLRILLSEYSSITQDSSS
ncbi:MAG: hypothetical protein WAM14_22415 [Candidatus Nitrosopolaris sp.]